MARNPFDPFDGLGDLTSPLDEVQRRMDELMPSRQIRDLTTPARVDEVIEASMSPQLQESLNAAYPSIAALRTAQFPAGQELVSALESFETRLGRNSAVTVVYWLLFSPVALFVWLVLAKLTFQFALLMLPQLWECLL